MNDFKFYIEINTVKSTSGGESDPWVFEGIASTADVDLYNEVVYPESFSKSIEFFKTNGKIFFDHEYAKKNDDWLSKHGFTKEEILALKGPIGKPIDAKITDEGLYIKGVLNKEHPMARIMWEKYLNNKEDTFREDIGLSIGAKYLGTPKKEFDVRKGRYITYLPELLLYEVSMTPEPVNPYTKTWASVLKSLVSDDDKSHEVHVIEPADVLYDADSGRLIVKSVIEGGDGIVHVFEQYVDIKEDIRNMKAEDEKVTLKAALPGQEEESQEEPAAVEGAAEKEGAPVEDAGAPDMADDAAPAPEMGDEMGAPDMAEPEDPMGGGDMDGAAPGGDASSVLDSLVTGDDVGGEMGADPMVGDADASMDMLLDKQDTILDLLGQVLDALHGTAMERSNPAEQQITQEQPSAELLKSIFSDNIKPVVKDAMSEVNSSVEISEDSLNALKSVFDGFEDRLAVKIVNTLRAETTVVKKSVESAPREEAPVNPGVRVSGVSVEADTVTLKSVLPVAESDVEVDLDAVRAFTNEYLAISGHTTSSIQKRANVLSRAIKSLNISELEFRALVRKAEKEQL